MNEIQVVTVTALSMYAISGLFIAAINQLRGELTLSERRLEKERNKEPEYITQWKTPPEPSTYFNFDGAQALPGDVFVWTGGELQMLAAPEPLVLPEFLDGSVVTVIGDHL